MLLLFATHVATSVLAAVLTLSLCRLTWDIRNPVSPAHFVALSKEIAAAAWTRRVRAAAKRNGKRRGRPRVPDALKRHILQIKRENPSYGKQRIASILSQTVGTPVCANTVAAVLKRHPAPRFPAAPAGSRWRSFVNAVCGRAASLDFKVVNDVFGRQVYILSVLHLARRRLLVCNATHNPTSDWITQQLREAFPFDTAPKYLFLDNDPLFANAVATTLPAMGITPVRIMPGRPQMNAHIERFNRTLTTELLDQIPILGAHQLIRLLHEYRRFYNTARPHQANGGEPPDHMPAPANDTGVPDAIVSILGNVPNDVEKRSGRRCGFHGYAA